MKKRVFLFVGLALTAVAAWADPLLRIGFLTDTHVDTTAQSLALVRSAFDLFKAQGVDVVVHGGDLANKHYAGGYQAYQQAFAEAFAGVTPPREIFAYGNHTSYGDPSGTLGWAEAFADKRTQLGGESVNAAFDRIDLNGYTFLAMPYAGAIGSEGVATWSDYEAAVAQACADNPGEPVFVVEHEPPQNTIYNTAKEWGSAKVREILDRYPQVVELSGHVHGSLRNDLYIWQGAFTVINAGCLQTWNGLLDGKAAPTAKPANDVLTIEVYADRLVARRWDLLDGHEIAAEAPWTVPLPFDAATAPYNRATRTAAEPVPAFGAGDAVTVTAANGALNVGFPQVPEYAMTYRIVVRAKDLDGVWQTVARTEIFSDFWKEESARGDAASASVSSDEFLSSTEYRVEVRPVSQYEVEGEPIAATVTTPSDFVDMTPDYFVDYVESSGTQYVDLRVIGRSGTKVEADFAYLSLGSASGDDLSFMGARADAGTDSRLMPFHTFRREATLGYGKFIYPKNVSPNKVTYIAEGERYALVSDLRAGSQTVSLNGTNAYVATDAAAIDTGRNLYLFADNVAGTPRYAAKIRCYGLRISQTDANGDYRPVRDLVPCVKGGKGMLYDRIEGRLYRGRSVSDGSVSKLVAPRAFARTVPGKPDAFVEYIQSDGTQILDTGVPARTGIRSAGRMSWTALAGETTYLGAAATGVRMYQIHQVAGSVWLGHGPFVLYPQKDGTNRRFPVGEPFAFDSDYTVRQSLSLTLGEELVMTHASDADADTGYDLTLFGAVVDGEFRYRAKARCYGLRIWLDGTLVRDFKPCVKENKGALYDAVRDEVVFPTGDIPLSAVGAEIVDPQLGYRFARADYVEGTGTQFLDLEVIAKSGTKLETKAEWTHTTKSDDLAFCGARNGDTRFFLLHNYLTQISYGYGTWKGCSRFIGPDEPHEYVSILDAGQQQMWMDGTRILNAADAATIDTGLNLFLFANNYSGGNYTSRAKCFYCRIWQKDGDGVYQLVRDLRPCRVIRPGGGFFGAFRDEVSGRLFRGRNSSGDTADFVVAPPPGLTILFH